MITQTALTVYACVQHNYINFIAQSVSRLGLSGKAISVRFRFGYPPALKVVVCGHCLVTLLLTINEALKWLSSLPVLEQESFRWWQCSDRYSLPLPPPPGTSVEVERQLKFPAGMNKVYCTVYCKSVIVSNHSSFPPSFSFLVSYPLSFFLLSHFLALAFRLLLLRLYHFPSFLSVQNLFTSVIFGWSLWSLDLFLRFLHLRPLLSLSPLIFSSSSLFLSLFSSFLTLSFLAFSVRDLYAFSLVYPFCFLLFLFLAP